MKAHTLGQTKTHICKDSGVDTHICKRLLFYLSLTEVPGHSVPEAETCRVLHRCEWSGLQCVWAPGHRKTGGGTEVEIHAAAESKQHSVHVVSTGWWKELIPSHCSPLQQSALESCSLLPPSQRQCWRRQHLELEGESWINDTDQPHRHICISTAIRHVRVFTCCLLTLLIVHTKLSSLLALLTSLPLITTERNSSNTFFKTGNNKMPKTHQRRHFPFINQLNSKPDCTMCGSVIPSIAGGLTNMTYIPFKEPRGTERPASSITCTIRSSTHVRFHC